MIQGTVLLEEIRYTSHSTYKIDADICQWSFLPHDEIYAYFVFALLHLIRFDTCKELWNVIQGHDWVPILRGGKAGLFEKGPF